MPSIRGILSLAVLLLLVLAPAGARAGDGSKLLRYLPADAEMVAVIDVAGARRKPLVKEWASEAGDGWKGKAAAAGIDPLKDVDTVLVAAAFTGADKFRLAIVEGRFAADAPSRLGEGRREQKHGKVSYWVDDETGAVLIGKRLVVAPVAAMPAVIELMSGKATAPRLGKAAPLRAVIAATDTRHHVWVASVFAGELRQKAADLAADAVGFALGASIGKGLGLEARLLYASEASATTSADQVRAALPQATAALAAFGFSSAVASVSIDREGNAVRVTASMTADELAMLRGVLDLGSVAPGVTGP
jgi:hypothetical protein